MIAKLKKAGFEVEVEWEDPREDVDDTIVRVSGHGIEETIYTHDEESVERLLEVARQAKAG